MGKKVLILSSSLRNGGNSDALCDQFAKGAQAAGHSVEKVQLSKLTIKPCLGCYGCQRNGGSCVQKDDMTALLQSLRQADVWVFATPVYFYNVSATLKLAMDRTFPLFGIQEKKSAYFIYASVSTKLEEMDAMKASFQQFLDCFPGVTNAGTLEGGGADKVGDVKSLPVFQQAFELGKAIE